MSDLSSRRSEVIRGPFFEDLWLGRKLLHGGRTITETDNIWFSLLTCNSNPIHFDRTYASRTEFGRPIINSALTLALATGLSVQDLSRNGINLGWQDVRLPAPLFPGDTLICESEILGCRPSKSRKEMGIVEIRTIGRNQSGEIVIDFKRNILVQRRPAQERHYPGSDGEGA